MLKSNAVFILGAGASYEVGFPLGFKLREIISGKLHFESSDPFRQLRGGEVKIAEKLQKKFSSDYHEYIMVCAQISDGILLSDSIDDFIDKHSHDERISICGKLGIAFSIIEAESKSRLFVDPSNIYNTIDFRTMGITWYSKIYSLLTKGVQKANLNSIFENITVINFNYDRSLEHFLAHALSKDYIIDLGEAQTIVDKLTIYRPYGSMDRSVPFGSNRLPDLDSIVSNLKTYTEKIEEGEELKKVKAAIEAAHTMVFLGMAYHVNNMSLLQCECDMRKKIIYATRKGISDHDLPVVARRILGISFQDTIRDIDQWIGSDREATNIFFSQECHDLFDDYRLSLSEL